MANIEVLRNALAAALKYPEQHRQSSWAAGDLVDYGGPGIEVQADNGDHPPCGTTLCEAGWIAFQNAPKGSRIVGGRIILPDGGGRPPIRDFAEEVADLDWNQAEALFIDARDADDLKAAIGFLEANPKASGGDLRSAIYDARDARVTV